MDGERDALKREGKPEENAEAEESFLSRLQPEEQVIESEDVESLIRETSLALKELAEGGIQLVWSSLEPREELLWSRKGNTVRSIALRDRHYSEHVELGVCEVSDTFEASIKNLGRRSFLKATYEMTFKPVSEKAKFIESKGGKGGWREELNGLLSEIASGALPERMVFPLPDLTAGDLSSWPIWSFKGERIHLRLDRGFLALELSAEMKPQSVRIELNGGEIAAKRPMPALNAWSFALPMGVEWRDLTYRPLVIDFLEPGLIGSRTNHLWPSVSVVELMEAFTRSGIT